MKVNFVHQSFADYTAGLTGALKQKVSLNVVCVASGQPAVGLTDSASQVQRCRRFRSPLSPISAWKAVRAVADDKVDVLHWQAAGNPWVDLAGLKLVKSLASVVTIHDIEPHPGDKAVLPGTFPAIMRLAKAADHVIVHAESVKQRACELGIVPNHISVVPHGELGTIYRPAPLELSPQTKQDSQPTVLFFGRAYRYKGLNIAIEAMNRVVEFLPSARLIVAGDGPELDILKGGRQPEWLDLQDGYVGRADVPGLFENADVVVVPYIEASQSGVAALAVGLHKAVVGSAVGGLVELVDHNRTGLLVTPGDSIALADALLDVLSDDKQQQRFELNAAELAASRLAWPQIADQTVEIYRQVIASRKKC